MSIINSTNKKNRNNNNNKNNKAPTRTHTNIIMYYSRNHKHILVFEDVYISEND